jgi:hypothetical protein
MSYVQSAGIRSTGAGSRAVVRPKLPTLWQSPLPARGVGLFDTLEESVGWLIKVVGITFAAGVGAYVLFTFGPHLFGFARRVRERGRARYSSSGSRARRRSREPITVASYRYRENPAQPATVAKIRRAAAAASASHLPAQARRKIAALGRGMYKVSASGGKVSRFSTPSWAGQLTSTRIAASKSGRPHLWVDARDPGFPVVLRRFDGRGQTTYRVEERARRRTRSRTRRRGVAANARRKRTSRPRRPTQRAIVIPYDPRPSFAVQWAPDGWKAAEAVLGRPIKWSSAARGATAAEAVQRLEAAVGQSMQPWSYVDREAVERDVQIVVPEEG